jgi:hypothetical protein
MYSTFNLKFSIYLYIDIVFFSITNEYSKVYASNVFVSYKII